MKKRKSVKKASNKYKNINKNKKNNFKVIIISIIIFILILGTALIINSIVNSTNNSSDTGLPSLIGDFNPFSILFKVFQKQSTSVYRVTGAIPLNGDCTNNPAGCGECTFCENPTSNLMIIEFLGWNPPYNEDSWWCPPCKIVHNNYPNLFSPLGLSVGTVMAHSGSSPSSDQYLMQAYKIGGVPSAVLIDKNQIEKVQLIPNGPYISIYKMIDKTTIDKNYPNAAVQKFRDKINEINLKQKRFCKPLPDIDSTTGKPRPCTKTGIPPYGDKPGVCKSGICIENPPATPVCTSDDKCLGYAAIGGKYCSIEGTNHVVMQNYTRKCENPNTANAKCLEGTFSKKLNDCVAPKIECENGECIELPTPDNTIKCSTDLECGPKTPFNPPKKSCRNKIIYETFNKPLCINPGTVSSSCKNPNPVEEIDIICKYKCTNEYCIYLKLFIYAEDSDYAQLLTNLDGITIKKERINKTKAQEIIGIKGTLVPVINSPTIILAEVDEQENVLKVIMSTRDSVTSPDGNSLIYKTLTDIIDKINELLA